MLLISSARFLRLLLYSTPLLIVYLFTNTLYRLMSVKLLTTSSTLITSPYTTLSLVLVSAITPLLLLIQLSMLTSCLPSALPTLRPLLFTPVVLLTLLVMLITALLLSKVRRRLWLSLAACLLVESRTGLVLTIYRVIVVLTIALPTLIRVLLLRLLVVFLLILADRLLLL